MDEREELLVSNDPLLRPLIAARSDAERALAIEEVLARHALPVVRQIIARQQYAGGVLSAQDAEDLVSSVALRLVRKLQRVPLERAEAVERLSDFAAVSAFNAIHDFLRRHFPERTRLQSRVLYVLARDRRFRTWSSPAGTLCGLGSWSAGLERGGVPETWRHGDATHPADAIESLLSAAARPLLVDDVVGALATAWRIADTRPADITELADGRESQAVRLETRHRLEALWRETCALPGPQRTALLLNLRDVDGGNAIALLQVLGIATLSEVAAAIELPVPRLAELWPRLPLDDLTVASLLGVTRQQVINLRLAARQRLARRMKKW